MIEIKYWKGGYLQTGNGDEITIITRDEEGKRTGRLVFNASETEEIIIKLQDVCKKPKKQEIIC